MEKIRMDLTARQLVMLTKWAKKTAPRLGEALAELQGLAESAWMDYEMDGSGELGAVIARGHERCAEQICREHGFFNIYHFMSALEMLTSKKFVYNSGVQQFAPR